MYIPRGSYLTLEQYRLKIGGVTRQTVLKAIKDGRLKGSIRIDKHTIIIPENAILYNGTIKTGKYIGVSAFIKGNIVEQNEVRDWEAKQAQLRKMRGEDLTDDEPDSEAYNDYH